MGMRNVLSRLLSNTSLWRFALIGLLATGLHAGVAVGMLTFTPVSVFVANLAGFLIAVSISFFGHFYWSFNSTRSMRSAAPRFFTMAILGFLINMMVLALLMRVFPQGMIIGKLLFSILVMPLSTYFLGRLWVFKSREI
jgi:putative flippase GtrA